MTDVLDRPGCQVLQIRHEGLKLPGREGWIPIEVLPHARRVAWLTVDFLPVPIFRFDIGKEGWLAA